MFSVCHTEQRKNTQLGEHGVIGLVEIRPSCFTWMTLSQWLGMLHIVGIPWPMGTGSFLMPRAKSGGTRRTNLESNPGHLV